MQEHKFQRVALDEHLWAEIMPLAVKHHQEVSVYKDLKLEPNYEAYAKLEDIGMMRSYLVRSDGGRLIGYCLFLVHDSLHFRSARYAAQESVFIHPEYRGFGKVFLSWCDEELRKEGIAVVCHYVPKEHQQLGKVLDFLNYEETGQMYVRRLN